MVAEHCHLFVVQFGVKGNQHVIRVLLVDLNAQGFHFPGFNLIRQQERFLARKAAGHVPARGLAAGEHMAEFFRHPHAGQLFLIKGRRLGGIVGQEQALPSGVVQRLQKIQGAFDQLIAQIKGAVHIQQEAADRRQPFPNIHLSFLPSAPRQSG